MESFPTDNINSPGPEFNSPTLWSGYTACMPRRRRNFCFMALVGVFFYNREVALNFGSWAG